MLFKTLIIKFAVNRMI